MITANGIRVTSAAFVFPRTGIWTVTAKLDEPEALTGSVTIRDEQSGRVFVGTIVRSHVDGGRATFFAVGGAGGWSRSVAARGYHNAAGVPRNTVVADATRDVGETLSAPLTGAVGLHYARRADAASKVLHDLFPGAWYVGDDGATRCTSPVATTYAKTDDTVVSPGTVPGTVTIRTDSLAGLQAGMTIDGVAYGDVEVTITESSITATAYAYGDETSLVNKLANAVDARSKYRGIYEYRVTSVDSDYRVNLQPTTPSDGVPELQRVAFRGVPGYRSKPQVGALLVVSFLSGNPARPVIVAASDLAGDGWAGASGQFIDVASNGASPALVALAEQVNANFERVVSEVSAALTAVGAGAAANGPGAAAQWELAFAPEPVGQPFLDVSNQHVRVS